MVVEGRCEERARPEGLAGEGRDWNRGCVSFIPSQPKITASSGVVKSSAWLKGAGVKDPRVGLFKGSDLNKFGSGDCSIFASQAVQSFSWGRE